jgi:hypothetical protein
MTLQSCPVIPALLFLRSYWLFSASSGFRRVGRDVTLYTNLPAYLVTAVMKVSRGQVLVLEGVTACTVTSDCGFIQHTGCKHMLLSPTFRERVGANCGATDKQFDWLDTNKKWAGPLLAPRPDLMLLLAGVKPQSLVTVVDKHVKAILS